LFVQGLGAILASDLHVDKVNLELLVCLDTDEERGAATSGKGLVGVVLGLEDEGEGALELFENSLDEFGEGGLLLVLVVDVLCEDCDGLRVRLAREHVAALLEDEAELGAVGDDAVVDDDELGVGIGAVGVAVAGRRRTMGCPAGVGDGDLGDGCLLDVDGRCGDLLAETGDLADLLEVDDVARLVAVDAEAGGVVSTILLAGEASAQDFEDLLARLAGGEQKWNVCKGGALPSP